MKTYGIIIPKGSKRYQESEKKLMEYIVSRPILNEDTVIKTKRKYNKKVKSNIYIGS